MHTPRGLAEMRTSEEPPPMPEIPQLSSTWTPEMQVWVSHLPQHFFRRAVHYYKTEVQFRWLLHEHYTNYRRSVDLGYYALDAPAIFAPIFPFTPETPPGLKRPTRGQLLMDRDYFVNRQASRQLDCVQQFWQGGASVKTLKPGGSGFAIMHTKTITIDDAVFLSGSLKPDAERPD